MIHRRKKFRYYALKLCLWLFVIFLIQLLLNGFTDLFLLNSKSYTEVWRFVTSIFLHGSFAHLLYNIFALGLFGSMLERLIGEKKLIIIFLATGILANIVSVNFYDSSLGASGAIFGLIGALIVIRPFMPVFAFGMPMPLILAGAMWVVGDLIGLFMPSNIANLAHLSGIFFGILFGFLYKRKTIKII